MVTPTRPVTAGPVTNPTVRLWHTALVLTTLIAQTRDGTPFPVTGLVIVLVVFAVVWPLQRWLRDSVSRRRRERWAQEGAEAELDRAEPGNGHDEAPDERGRREPW